MANRLELQQEFVNILGSNNVYYRPPETIKLKYPCIIYKRTPGTTVYADNQIYWNQKHYDVTAIYKDPDSDLVDRILYALPYIRHDRHFFADGLNHDVFSLYY